VNGSARAVPLPRSVRALLEELGMPFDRVVVERNGEILDRARLDEVEVCAGDVFELVRLVGGG
jgi:thiamine biosynthesis protein ThiS